MGERDVTSPQIAVSLPSGPVMPEETSSPDISAGTDATVAGRAEEERTEPWPTEAAPAEPAEIPFADDEDIEVEGEEDESIA